MNGQTGKIVGKLPIDKKRVFGFWSLFAGCGFTLLMLIQALSAWAEYLG